MPIEVRVCQQDNSCIAANFSKEKKYLQAGSEHEKLKIKGKKQKNHTHNQNEQRLVRNPKERTHNRLDSPVESQVLLFRKTQPYNLGPLGLPTY